MKNFRAFLSNEEGLVTIEWVGIAAVVVLAGIMISSYTLQQSKELGTQIGAKTNEVSDQVAGLDATTQLDFSISSGTGTR